MTDPLDDLLKRRFAQLPAVPPDETFVAAVEQRMKRHRQSLRAVYAVIAVLGAASLVLLAPLLQRLAQTVSTAPALVQPTLHWAFTSVPMGLAAAAAVIVWTWRRA